MKLNNYEKILGVPFPQPDIYGSLSMPIYHTLAYEFETAEEMEEAFRGQEGAYVLEGNKPNGTAFRGSVKAILMQAE